MTLKSELDAKRADFEAKAPQSKIDAYEQGVEAVRTSGILEQALSIGDTAIDFRLRNAQGKEVSLYEQLSQGTVVLTWYRGGWCPYCNMTLRSIQTHLPEFQAVGAQLLALTPELPDNSLSTSEKNGLTFEVLTDQDNQVARQYGLVFRLTPEVEVYYRNAFDFVSYNGNDEPEWPLAATYVIGQDNLIKYAFLDAEYRNRAEPVEILDVLKQL